MATYNGAKFVQEQLASILSELGPLDEVIVCDDGSTDETVRILKSFLDQRIHIYSNSVRLGHVRNFERALSLARGELIFLADQDDVWIPGRVLAMVESLDSHNGALLVASNFDLIDENGMPVGLFRKLGLARKSKIGQVFAIFAGRSPYFGCTFLMNRQCLSLCLPIPESIESHDIWIALVSSVFGKVVNLPNATLMHRLHGSNLTAPARRKLSTIARGRWVFFKSLVIRIAGKLRTQ
jgi:glycosyltransferase involved in cell wall biosynthesis